MYTLKNNGIINELENGNNFGYVLQESKYFSGTDYKVLQSQKNGIFIPCMKMMYNGKIELFYITEDYRPMSAMFEGITPDILINIIVNMFGSMVEVRNNGFLQSQNIDVSWEKIFVDTATLKVKLVYLPVHVKLFSSYPEFENELRSNLVKLINRVIAAPNARLDKLVPDLVNGSMSIEDIYHKHKGAVILPIAPSDDTLKLVAMNAPEHIEILMDKQKIIIGKKAELVDAAITFNKMISRKHCSVTRNKDGYYITDEGSANGTYVNRVKLIPHQPKAIKRGDIIRMADSDFQIV